MKVTDPVGVPEPGGVAATVAHTSTDWPVTEGSGADTTVVVVAAGFTVTLTVPTDPAIPESPLYVPVTVPVAKVAVVRQPSPVPSKATV
ncbi:hypothetical protein [Actinoplanes sp. NBRC 103695]|uniref:hypothetical protein n=1 Tax=Actinoplanes sp. NBRC 103695 TaxID=3032202 RepID=UPI0025547868|nr:hypothetical protein [Actinoplanes sp. NBRC 103695]